MSVFTIQSWLNTQFNNIPFLLERLAGDASFRVYFRVRQADHTWIAMDASSEKEKCPQFIAIANALRDKGVCTPEIIAHDFSQGYMLISDLGDGLYLNILNKDNADVLYKNALHTLHRIASCSSVSSYAVPRFTTALMREELTLFQEWFIEKYLGFTLSEEEQHLLNESFDTLLVEIAKQPIVFMHRDYHSANILLQSDTEVGVIDFQDAFFGPLTYDAVSLLRDCYIVWPEEEVKRWALYYRDLVLPSLSDQIFLIWFDMMSLQRHMKALLTFSRKYCRDHNANYLQHIPRTLEYLIQVSKRYPHFQRLHAFFKKIAEEKTKCVP